MSSEMNYTLRGQIGVLVYVCISSTLRQSTGFAEKFTYVIIFKLSINIDYVKYGFR